MLRIDPPQDLSLVKAQRDRMIRLARPRLPFGSGALHHCRKPVRILDDAPVDGFIKCVKTRLMRKELANGDLLFAVLRELRPISAHRRLEIEPTPRMG